MPEVVVCDAGKEFSQRFMKIAASHGIVTHQIGARAPWQQGKTERHGSHYKDLLEKARDEAVITSKEELKTLMHEVEAAKNRFSNRSGYSPVQRQIGQWPRMSGLPISDDLVDPHLLETSVGDDVERLLEFRRIAQKAFIEHNAREALKKVERSRSRVAQEFQAGDYVFVYRVPRQRKRKVGGPDHLGQSSNKPYWVGPGTVIVPDGACVWVSMFGELWKVAREQCRLATNPERQGIEAVMQECSQLVEEYKKTANRPGFKDITREPWPDEDVPRQMEEDTEEEEDGERRVRRRVESEEEYTPRQRKQRPTTQRQVTRRKDPVKVNQMQRRASRTLAHWKEDHQKRFNEAQKTWRSWKRSGDQ